MKLNSSTRKLLVLCGITAACRYEYENAHYIADALPYLVPDDVLRRQCEKIFEVLLDNRRLTQPSYNPCEELQQTLEASKSAASYQYKPV